MLPTPCVILTASAALNRPNHRPSSGGLTTSATFRGPNGLPRSDARVGMKVKTSDMAQGSQAAPIVRVDGFSGHCTA
jgi:hypothetical protein